MASALTGAVVGTFVVGDGTKVGQATFRADKPKMMLKGGAFHLTVVADLKQMVVGKPQLILGLTDIGHPPHPYAVRVSSTPTLGTPKLTLRGKHINLVTPTKAVIATSRMTLRGRSYGVAKSTILAIGHPKMTLKGGDITKVGRAGMVPSVPHAILLTPHGAPDSETLVPSPARAGLLTPTSEDFV